MITPKVTDEMVYVLLKHMDRAIALKLIQDLRKIQGNKSYNEMIELLATQLAFIINTKKTGE